VLTPLWWSLGHALINPALGTSVGARLAEWTRDHGGRGLVVWAENFWYSHNPPPTGGHPPAGAIPAPGTSPPAGLPAIPHLAPPEAIVPFVQPPVSGEGQWHPVGRLVDGHPAVYEAFLRPDSVHTSLVVGVAWFDTQLLRARLYSGSYIPGGGPWHYTAPIVPSDARSVVAAFNSGFRMRDARGGYYSEGRLMDPLRLGAASLVIYRDGTATVGAWGRNVSMTPNVIAVRQNLNLLVDGGHPVPSLDSNNTTIWGYTLANRVFVWRSGLGVTADGALVYVGGPGLNVTTLADILVRSGAKRAMELDINTDWVNLAAFTPAVAGGAASPANGQDLLPNMLGSPQRYFTTSWSRDFITMSARVPP